MRAPPENNFTPLFARKPWRDPGRKLPFRQPPGMLGPDERTMLYDIAREAWTGDGVIIDAGCYLGCSAFLFGRGIQDNEHVAGRPGSIHCFDRFTADAHGARLLQARGHSVVEGDSVRELFDANVAAVADLLTVHQGDFLQANWRPEPVEVLFVDLGKSIDLHNRVVEQFFPSLMPGRSIVLQQDYHHWALPHLHIAMEHLHPWFAIVDARTDFTASFVHTEPIPAAELQRAMRFDFDQATQLQLMQAAVDRLPAEHRGYVMLAQVTLLIRHRELDAAAGLFDRIASGPAPESSPDDGRLWPAALDGTHELLDRVR